MIEKIIRFSLANRYLVLVVAALVIAFAVTRLTLLPIDAVPDITNRQVQVNAKMPALGPLDMERRVTFPLELALNGLPRLEEVRSTSQFGLSQVTLVFEDDVDIYFARQLVNERLQEARESIPPNTVLEMAPVSTGLGEVYYLRIDNPKLSLMEKRTLLDWTVRPQLRSVPGLAEVNTWGGSVRQYQVRIDPNRLKAYELTFRDVVSAVAQSNDNAGGGYVYKGSEQQNVRTIGVLAGTSDLKRTVIKANEGVGVTLGELGDIVEGPMLRSGAITRDGEGEDAYAITMLLMGENGRTVVQRVKDRVKQIDSSLPSGSRLVGFMDRTALIDRTLETARKNLMEGGFLVIVLLFLFLGQLRAGLIVSSAIPLAMLIAVIGMYYMKVSANLMSLGAIDFGLIVDGSVIIVENCVRRLSQARYELRRELTNDERLEMIAEATVEVRSATQFGELIIIASYLPILSLQGLEGKMFRPMGMTVILALLGAMLLSFTVTPALCALFLKAHEEKPSRLLNWIRRIYSEVLLACFRHPIVLSVASVILMAVCGLLSTRLGGEFIPDLDEGSIALQCTYLPGSSLPTVVSRSTELERFLKKKFPDELGSIVSRIGRPEIATDPMQVFQADVLVELQPPGKWKRAHTQAELSEEIEKSLGDWPGVSISLSQPIKMRMMELIEGVGIRSDLGIKLFGPDPDVLQSEATHIAQVVRSVSGAEGVAVEATTGLPQLDLEIDRDRAARLGVRVDEINSVVEGALGQKPVTQIVDGSTRIDVIVTLPPSMRGNAELLSQLQIPTQTGILVPLSSVCRFIEKTGPAQVSRENGQRRIVVQANVRNRDLASFVEEVQSRINKQVKLPTGYHVEYAGTYEKMQSGRARLALIVPLTFLLILGLLFMSFGKLKDAFLVFVGVPLAACGGVLALLIRGLTLSISAAIGFIALAGVAVLNGVVMLHFIRDLHAKGEGAYFAAYHGAGERLRPVLMTASVAGFGFLPMALATGAGAEVQKPLATVVIGGLITSTLLTLLVLPTLWLHLRKAEDKLPPPSLDPNCQKGNS